MLATSWEAIQIKSRGAQCAEMTWRAISARPYKLEMPVFHIGYFKNIIAILQCICKAGPHAVPPHCYEVRL